VPLDLEGRGRQELLYRLYSGLAQNARSRNDEDSSFKTEPNLFLDRAVRFASSDEASKISSSAAGGQLTIKTADVLMFGGAPYLFTWDAGFGVLVYDAYSRRDRPYIPEEKIEGHTFILPTLRCIFESRPTH
jgi:hypothetical protein